MFPRMFSKGKVSATHNAPPMKEVDLEEKEKWCYVCKKFKKFFRLPTGTTFFCTDCRFEEGTKADFVTLED